MPAHPFLRTVRAVSAARPPLFSQDDSVKIAALSFPVYLIHIKQPLTTCSMFLSVKASCSTKYALLRMRFIARKSKLTIVNQSEGVVFSEKIKNGGRSVRIDRRELLGVVELHPGKRENPQTPERPTSIRIVRINSFGKVKSEFLHLLGG